PLVFKLVKLFTFVVFDDRADRDRERQRPGDPHRGEPPVTRTRTHRLHGTPAAEQRTEHRTAEQELTHEKPLRRPPPRYRAMRAGGSQLTEKVASIHDAPRPAAHRLPACAQWNASTVKSWRESSRAASTR